MPLIQARHEIIYTDEAGKRAAAQPLTKLNMPQKTLDALPKAAYIILGKEPEMPADTADKPAADKPAAKAAAKPAAKAAAKPAAKAAAKPAAKPAAADAAAGSTDDLV